MRALEAERIGEADAEADAEAQTEAEQQAHGEPEPLIAPPGNARGQRTGIVGGRPGQTSRERTG